jgi:flagellar assembly protein FliH
MEIAAGSSSLVMKERLQARAAAAGIIEKAQQQAQAIVGGAQAELARARKKGHREGRRAGERELAAQIAEAARLKDVASTRHLPGLIELAGLMAGRILRRELSLNPQSIEHICREVIRENRPGSLLKLVVNPRDLVRLQKERKPLVADPQTRVELSASPKIEPGGCMIHSELGEVDARLSVQLEELARALQDGCHD